MYLSMSLFTESKFIKNTKSKYAPIAINGNNFAYG